MTTPLKPLPRIPALVTVAYLPPWGDGPQTEAIEGPALDAQRLTLSRATATPARPQHTRPTTRRVAGSLEPSAMAT